jgi:glycine/D-amino acid oxidase-like deaminating enzyme
LQRESADAGSRVCIIEKSLIGAGITARHSGIVRAANAVPEAAKLAKRSMDYWNNLETIWGVDCEFERNGAVWIARDTENGKNTRWSNLSEVLSEIGIHFEQVDRQVAGDICGENVKLYENEVFYHEPEAIQFDPSVVRKALYDGLKTNNIETREKTRVQGFIQDDNGNIKTVLTSAGSFDCLNVVNAAGPWSPSIFESISVSIPLSAESVNVVNWLTSQLNINNKMPIIADYTNLAYFRLWRDGEIHMHQPRRRNVRETARIFAENPLQVKGADFVNEPANQALGYSEIKIYEDIVRKRFGKIGEGVYGSGYRSYFDITPDLKFILGRDRTVSNLFHCLGSGQAFKYTPVFGEILADCVMGKGEFLDDIENFSISRFDETYMENFWSHVEGREHGLETEAAHEL